MRSVVGLLPITCILLLAAGCALPGRTSKQSNALSLRSKNPPKSKITNERSSDDKIAFNAPSKKSKSRRSEDLSERPKSVKQASDTRENDDENPIELQGLELDQDETKPRRSIKTTSVWDEFDPDQANGNQPPANDVDLSSIDVIDRDLRTENVETGQSLEKPKQEAQLPVVNPVTPPLDQDKPDQIHPGKTAQANPKTDLTSSMRPLPWQTELNELISQVERSLAQSKADGVADQDPEYLKKQAHLRMLYLMAQRQEEALSVIPNVSASQQEYWQQMVWAMFNSLDASQSSDTSQRAARSIVPLGSALRHAREAAPLSIKNMAFCRKISSFGNYDRFPRNEFTPGYEVLLYTEIENFVSTLTADGNYRTSLKSQLEIVNSKGFVVWKKSFAPTEDLCRNARRDYFHNCQFQIPEDLPTGTYTLKLTVSDELSKKSTAGSLDFVLK